MSHSFSDRISEHLILHIGDSSANGGCKISLMSGIEMST